MENTTKFPHCRMYDAECFAYQDGNCRILSDSDFGGKPCPFRKTNAQVERELAEIAYHKTNREE